MNLVLCTPTGKASEILSSKTNIVSHTIHSLIYNIQEEKDKVVCIRKEIKYENQPVFIIDEASMVGAMLDNGNVDFKTNAPLIDDLFTFMRLSHQQYKVIFVGDRFQLPPVNEKISVALNSEMVQKRFGVLATTANLTEIKRFDSDNLIFKKSSQCRYAIDNGASINATADLYKFANRSKMYERFAYNFDIQKIDKIALITSTNKAANMHNREIRNRLFANANEGVQVGDLLMLTNTNYNKGNSLYNGQLGKVLALDSKIEEVAGLKFKYAKIEFNSNTTLVKTVYKPIILNLLNRDDVGLNISERKALTHHAFVNNKEFRESGIKSDDVFLSALQMRYAYAVTCHKAQGGEWENIVIDPYVAYADARMQYTAITRARKHVASYHC